MTIGDCGFRTTGVPAGAEDTWLRQATTSTARRPWEIPSTSPTSCRRSIIATMQQKWKRIVLLTNIIWIQDLDNNGNYWNRLEIWVRDLTQKFRDVWVVSGPLWLPEAEHQPAEEAGQGDGKAAGRGRKTPAVLGRVSYPVLGAGQVAVPTHLYKVVLVSDPAFTRPLLSCFVVPNQPLGDRHLTEFSVPLQQLEAAVGLAFHPDLEREQAADLCTETGCNL